jgi:hypothetical protein
MELHPKEVDLILLIRNKYQFGKITLETQHGLPYRIEKAVEYELIKGETKK